MAENFPKIMRWKTINLRPETLPPPPKKNSHLDIKVKLLKTNGEEKNPRKNLGVIQEKKETSTEECVVWTIADLLLGLCKPEDNGWQFLSTRWGWGRGRGKGHKPLSAQNPLLSKNIFEIWACNKHLFRKKAYRVHGQQTCATRNVKVLQSKEYKGRNSGPTQRNEEFLPLKWRFTKRAFPYFRPGNEYTEQKP